MRKDISVKKYMNLKAHVYLSRLIIGIFKCFFRIYHKKPKLTIFVSMSHDIAFITVHIFFNDAFEPRKSKTGKPMKGIKVNEYVKTLENVIPNTAK